jgi:DNA primase
LFWQAVRGKPKNDFVSKDARDGKARRARRDGKTKIELDQPVSIELKNELEDREHSRQKVLLGMLVHYPQFLDEKQDTILRLKFAAELDRFCSSLYQLLVMEKELSVQQIYSHLGDVFYNVLHDIHGMSPDGRSWGHKLFARFPLLAINPPPPLDFVSKSMDHLARRVHLDELDYDIQRAKTSAGDNDDAFDLLLSLIRERQNEHANIEVEGAELAEEAAEIRRFAVPNFKKTALVAPQHIAEGVFG